MHLSHLIDGLYLKLKKFNLGSHFGIQTGKMQEATVPKPLKTSKKAGSDFTWVVKDDVALEKQWECEHAHSLSEAWQELGSEAPNHFMFP